MTKLVLPVTIKHFTAAEIEMGRDIPDELLSNIHVTVMLLDQLREWYKNPIYVHSTYRSPEYNKLVGGKPNSLHLKFNAIDFGISRTSDLRKLYDKLDEWDHQQEVYHYPSMGLGLYERGKFIHVDTRGKFGMKRARWRE